MTRPGRTAPAVAALVVLAVLGMPATALAELTVAVSPADARYGRPHRASGRMTDAAGAPIAGRRIALQARPFPFTGAFRPVAHATTGADGRFTFEPVELPRNTDLRAVAFDGTTSGIARAWTYPAFTLTYKPAGRNRIRLVQKYRTPREVRLRSATLFYVGDASATSAPVWARARPRRTGAGRFTATATVSLPRAWKGRFRYASCFRYSPGSGMGDPSRGCPRRFRF